MYYISRLTFLRAYFPLRGFLGARRSAPTPAASHLPRASLRALPPRAVRARGCASLRHEPPPSGRALPPAPPRLSRAAVAPPERQREFPVRKCGGPGAGAEGRQAAAARAGVPLGCPRQRAGSGAGGGKNWGKSAWSRGAGGVTLLTWRGAEECAAGTRRRRRRRRRGSASPALSQVRPLLSSRLALPRRPFASAGRASCAGPGRRAVPRVGSFDPWAGP